MGSELIVFPELFATGYSFMSKEEAARVCETANGQTFRTMSGIARELKSFMAWGYLESDGENLYNSATLVGPHGELISKYRKINLWGNDFLWAKPGSEPAPVVTTDIGDLAVIICRDIRDKVPGNIPLHGVDIKRPKMFEQVDIVAACTNWGKSGFPTTQWMDFASNNKCTLAISNRWGEEQASNGFSQDFGHGGSIIIEKDWTCHTQGLVFGQDCVVTARIEESDG